MADNQYDAIVVGSGISGGWAAKELCEKGLKTIMLERGRDIKHIMLLHVGAFQTVMLPRLLELLQQRGFRLIPLPDAASDPAYAMQPDVASKFEGSFLDMSLAARNMTPVHHPSESLMWLDEVCR